jgi:hypothetical protein
MLAGRRVHARHSKHIMKCVRAEHLRNRRRVLLAMMVLGMFTGVAGAASFAVMLGSKLIPNPLRGRRQNFTRRHSPWVQHAQAMDAQTFALCFGFPSYATAVRVAQVLGMHAVYRGSHGHRADRMEAFLLVCARLRSMGTWQSLSQREPFNHPTSDWSTAKMSFIFKSVMSHLDGMHRARVAWSDACFSPGRCQTYKQKIANGKFPCPVQDLIGFLDGTCRPICKPSLFQRSMYTGWKKRHQLKWSCVVTPDGMIASCTGPYAGRRTDRHMLRSSNLKQHFLANVPGCVLFADSGYSRDAAFLHVPFPGPWAARCAFNYMYDVALEDGDDCHACLLEACMCFRCHS